MVKEDNDQSHRVAFRGGDMKEDLQEFGPRDAPEEDADNAPPTVGKNLSKVAEDEMEFLDGLKLKGFPEDEARRRERHGRSCLELIVRRCAGLITRSAISQIAYSSIY